MWDFENVKIWYTVLFLCLAANSAALEYSADPYYSVDFRAQTVHINYAHEGNGKLFLLVQALVSMLLSMFNVILLFGTAAVVLYYSLKTRRARVAPTRSQNTRTLLPNLSIKKELNLSVFAIVLSGTMALFLVYAYMSLIEQGSDLRDFIRFFKKIILHFAIDIMSVVNPFGLLLLSRVLRDRIAEILVPKRNLPSEKHEKRKRIVSTAFLSLAIAYFVYLLIVILATADIYLHCSPYNLKYVKKLVNCDIPMKCANHKGMSFWQFSLNGKSSSQ